ncbi:MAG: phage holin family protein [Bacteroidota bacterium]
MFKFILIVLANSVALWLGAQFLRGIKVTDFPRAVITGLVVAVLNATLGKILSFISAPINWITFGLFSLVISAVVLMVADYFMKGLTIKNFWWALALAILVSAVNVVLVEWIFRYN